ncbi:hypothetical protein F4804DRAFT_116259 [Jackrogersella minutella]|nr:hypothetical protein F4804DRAFT_116259 [Jackrogersella minutella]
MAGYEMTCGALRITRPNCGIATCPPYAGQIHQTYRPSGYFDTDYFVSQRYVDLSLPANTAVVVGYSGWSLLGLMVTSCVLITIHIVLSLKRIPSNMVIVGSNSLALSAACHVSNISHAIKGRRDSSLNDSQTSPIHDLPASPQPLRQSYTLVPDEYYDHESNRDGGIHMRDLKVPSMTCTRHSSQLSLASKRLLPDRRSENSADAEDGGDEAQGGTFSKLARSKIQWGVVKMPPDWHSEYDNEDGVVERLSFGVEEDDVQPPEPEKCYA